MNQQEAQVKLLEKEKAQEEILSNVSTHIINENLDRNNLTIVGEEEDEYTVMKSEIILLSQLVREVKDKNDILKQLLEEKNKTIEELKQKCTNTSITYAQVTRKNKSIIEHAPSVIVTAKTHKGKEKINNIVTKKLLNDVIVPINKFYETKDGSVKIKCANKDDVVKLKDQLSETIGCDYMVKQEEILNPRLKIVGIDNNMKPEELEMDIIERNHLDNESYCSVEHIFTNNRTNTRTAIITVPAEVYSRIRANGSKIYIGHQCLRVYDELNIMPCYNCGRVGHSGKKCRNETACLRCAGNHQTINCDGKSTPKCVNCCFGKDKFKDNRDVNHIATDSENCQYLKIMIKKKISNTDYPMEPKIQRFLGYKGNVINNHTEVIKETTNRQRNKQVKIANSARTRSTTPNDGGT